MERLDKLLKDVEMTAGVLGYVVVVIDDDERKVIVNVNGVTNHPSSLIGGIQLGLDKIRKSHLDHFEVRGKASEKIQS